MKYPNLVVILKNEMCRNDSFNADRIDASSLSSIIEDCTSKEFNLIRGE